MRSNTTTSICGGIYARVYCIFVVRARCRRKESSRSLSHLLMSFLYTLVIVLKLLHTVGYAAANYFRPQSPDP